MQLKKTDNFGHFLKHNNFVIFLGCLLTVLFLLSHLALLTGQFEGEDEALQFWAAWRILQTWQEMPLITAIKQTLGILANDYHPPLRTIISLGGLIVLPPGEFAVRAGAIVGSAIMTVVLMLMGLRLSGSRAAWAVGFIVCSSAVFSWTSMAFGWSILVSAVGIAFLIAEKRGFLLEKRQDVLWAWSVLVCLSIAYLINSGAAIMAAGYVLLLVYSNIRRPMQTFITLAPFLVGYIFYMLLFFWLPDFSGQALQTRYRISMASLNITSFVVNLKGLNGYFFPYIFWLLGLLGIWRAFKTHRWFLTLILPYILAWSFYFRVETLQYMILAFLLVLPFGIAWMDVNLRGWKFIAITALLCMMSGLWNILIFQIPRAPTEESFVNETKVFRYGWAGITRRHNIREPYSDLSRILNVFTQDDKGDYIDDLSGPFNLLYSQGFQPAGPDHPGRSGTLGSSEYPLRKRQEDTWEILDWEAWPTLILTRRVLHTEKYSLSNQLEGSLIRVYCLQ